MKKVLTSKFTHGLLTGLLLAAALAGAILELTGSTVEKKASGLDAEARSVIQRNYYKPVSTHELDEASIDGIVDRLRKQHKDRFSHYFTPKDLKSFNEATSGSVNGIGLTVSEVKPGLRIATVLPGTPAEKAGLQPGDVITQVNGKSIAGDSADVAASKIKGPPGTKVSLLVKTSEGKSRKLDVERAKVRVPAVDGKIHRTPDGSKIGYVRFTTFSSGAHGELRDTVERLYHQGAQGIVLDLRGNGGGLLNEAILSASVFIQKGKIVSTKSRTQGDKTYDAVGDAIEHKPTVVLINRDTASAAEILSAALQYYKDAKLVGTRSFGKGVFQEVIHLDAGGALDLTIGQYFTASGASLTGKGVKPDIHASDSVKRPNASLRAGLRELDDEIPAAGSGEKP